MHQHQVIFDKNEILKKDDTPYVVFTPYSKRWKEKISAGGGGLAGQRFKRHYRYILSFT